MEAAHTELRFRIPDVDEQTKAAVAQTLVELPGVEAVRVDAEGGDVVVVADRRVVSDDELLAAIGENGFEARRA